jgi:hypothetical protein
MSIENNHTIIKLNMLDNKYDLIDSWFDGKFIHFRAGSCFGVGSKRNRNEEAVKKFFPNLNNLLNCLNSKNIYFICLYEINENILHINVVSNILLIQYVLVLRSSTTIQLVYKLTLSLKYPNLVISPYIF